MIAILSLLGAIRKVVGAVWDSLPDTVKVLLFSIAVVAVTNVITWRYTVFTTTSRIENAQREKDRKAEEDASKARKYQAANYAKLLSDLSKKAADAEAEVNRLRNLKQEVNKYVTAKADRSCTIPTGFEFVFNESATGTGSGLPASVGMDVDQASGVTLSEVARTTIENNAECRERGRVIEAWQEWYPRAKYIFEKTKRIAEGVDPPAENATP